MGKRGTLDQMESIAKKVPILDRLEVDKMLAFIKLLFLEPLTGITLIIAVASGLSYSGDPDEGSLIGALVGLFIFSYVIFNRTKIIIEMKKIQEDIKIRKDTLGVAEKAVFNQESLRAEWFIGWKEILLEEKTIHSLYYNKVLNLKLSKDEEETAISLILQGFDNTKRHYEDLFRHIDNSMREFQLGMSKPPSAPATEILEDYEILIKRLNRIVGTVPKEKEEEKKRDIGDI